MEYTPEQRKKVDELIEKRKEAYDNYQKFVEANSVITSDNKEDEIIPTFGDRTTIMSPTRELTITMDNYLEFKRLSDELQATQKEMGNYLTSISNQQ